MLESCENWLRLVNSVANYVFQTSKIYQVFPYTVDSKAPGELWNPLSKTVPSKYSFISNKGPASI